MATGTFLSRVLGLAKVMILAAAIGQTSSISADAFANGNLLPNTLYVILLGGILSAILVPQIVKSAKHSDGGDAYINKVLTLVIVFLLVATSLAVVSAPVLVTIFQLSWSSEQLALSAAFAYWCLPQILFYGIYSVMGEVLNARSVFGPYTWAPVLNNVISIAGIVAFIYLFGADPSGSRTAEDWTTLSVALLAGSATLGVMAQALVLFSSWRRAGIRYRPDFRWRGMGLRETANVARWGLATIVVIQLGGLVTSNVAGSASGQGPSTAALGNAWLVLMLPHSVLAVSLATAYFTRLSEAGRDGKKEVFLKDFSSATRQIVLIMVLASVVIFAASFFLSGLIERGGPQKVEEFAFVLQCYVFSLVPFSFLFVVQRSFYALSDTKTPFLFTCAQQVIFVILTLMTLIVPAEMRGAAITVAYSVATFIQAVLATILLRKKIGSVDGRMLSRSFIRFLIASVPSAIAGLFTSAWLQAEGGLSGFAGNLIGAFIVASVSSIVYFLTLVLTRSPETSDVLGQFRKRALRQ